MSQRGRGANRTPRRDGHGARISWAWAHSGTPQLRSPHGRTARVGREEVPGREPWRSGAARSPHGVTARGHRTGSPRGTAGRFGHEPRGRQRLPKGLPWLAALSSAAGRAPSGAVRAVRAARQGTGTERRHSARGAGMARGSRPSPRRLSCGAPRGHPGGPRGPPGPAGAADAPGIAAAGGSGMRRPLRPRSRGRRSARSGVPQHRGAFKEELAAGGAADAAVCLRSSGVWKWLKSLRVLTGPECASGAELRALHLAPGAGPATAPGAGPSGRARTARSGARAAETSKVPSGGAESRPPPPLTAPHGPPPPLTAPHGPPRPLTAPPGPSHPCAVGTAGAASEHCEPLPRSGPNGRK